MLDGNKQLKNDHEESETDADSTPPDTKKKKKISHCSFLSVGWWELISFI